MPQLFRLSTARFTGWWYDWREDPGLRWRSTLGCMLAACFAGSKRLRPQLHQLSLPAPQKSFMKKVFILSLFCAAFVLFWPQSTLAQQVSTPPVEEIRLSLQGIDNKRYDVAELRGQVLLVSFGATWCLPCAAELRALEELKKEYENKPVKIFWVSIEREEEASDQKLRAYAKTHKLTFPVLRDPSKLNYAQFSNRLRLPLVIFFDKEGKLVVPNHFGMSTPELYKSTMRERLNKLLATDSSAISTGTK